MTDQETAIYDALNAGDHDAIEQLREDAYAADQTWPEDATGDPPEDWLPPAQQFEVDYLNAWNHYQADHEAPEPAREVATKAQVYDQNIAAA